MSVFSPRTHGVLDYAMVLLFALAPTILDLTEISARLSYVLAGLHLLMTLLTAFPLGATDFIPFNAHGAVELVVALVLLIGPWVLNGWFGPTGRFFITIMGALILAVRLLTNYQPQVRPST